MKRRALHAGLLAGILTCLLGGARSAPPAVAAVPAAAPLTLTPAIGVPGTIVALSIPAGGLPANDEADVLFQDATNTYLGLLLLRGMTGPDGSFNARVPMAPEAAAGVGRIFVNAAGNITTSAPFTVRPVIQVLPNPIQAGTGFQVVGNGFSSGYPITIQQDNGRGLGPQPLTALGGENTYANALGNFTALLILDKHSPVGSVQISATDLVLTATAALQTTDPNALSSAPIFGATPPFSTTVGQVTGTPPLAQTTIPVPPTVTPVSGPGSGATATQGFGNAPSPAPTATPVLIAGTGTTAYFAEGFTGQAKAAGQASFTESLNLLNATDAAAPVTITYVLGGASAPVVVSRMVGPRSVLREPVNVDVGPGREVAAIVTSPARIAASRSIGRVGANGARLGGSTALPVAATSRSWGFPEGYTGYSFQEYLTLLNPGGLPATVRVQLAPQGDSARSARVVSLTVPPHARTTANIRALNAGSTTSSVGMIVGSDQPIVAERVEYFGDGSGSGKFGSTVTPGIVAPATALRFGFGSSGGRAGTGANAGEHYITLLNPATSGMPVSVTTSYSGATGGSLGQARVAISPGTRRTIVASSVLGSAETGTFGVALQASGPIEAEASQYFGGSPNSGTHAGVIVPGVASPSADLFFADLSTTMTDGTPLTQTVYLSNPGAAQLTVDATYFGSGGRPVTKSYSVAAGGITAVVVNHDVGAPLPGSTTQASQPSGFSAVLGAEFRASGPVVAYATASSVEGRAITGIAGAP